MSAMALTEHRFCIFEDLFWKIADNPTLKKCQGISTMPDQD
jgi:hypothetical protein